MIATGLYPARVLKTADGLIPTSDGAGEVAAVGEGVKKWTIGDRVSPNFSTAHIRGGESSSSAFPTSGAKRSGLSVAWYVEVVG